jgi:hypothetical protein
MSRSPTLVLRGAETGRAIDRSRFSSCSEGSKQRVGLYRLVLVGWSIGWLPRDNRNGS